MLSKMLADPKIHPSNQIILFCLTAPLVPFKKVFCSPSLLRLFLNSAFYPMQRMFLNMYHNLLSFFSFVLQITGRTSFFYLKSSLVARWAYTNLMGIVVPPKLLDFTSKPLTFYEALGHQAM